MKKALLILTMMLSIFFIEAQVLGDAYTDTSGIIYLISNEGPPAEVTAGDGLEGVDAGGIGITDITIPLSISTIDGDFAVTGFTAKAFAQNATLTSAVIGEISGLTEIPAQVFFRCPLLTSVTLPSTVTSLGTAVFQDCTALTEIVNFTNLTAIGRSGLQGLTGMTEADLNAGVVNVINYGRRTFRNNTHVTEFVLPSAVTLANQVFQGCSALTSIVLGPNVTSINADMFGGFTTTGLTSLELQVLDPASIDNVPTGDFSATTLTVPAGSLALYQASAWGSAGFLDIVAAPILSTNAVDNELDFNLYPNPASGSVNISSASNADIDVVVYDVLGKVVSEATVTNTLDVSALKAGIYIIKATQDGSQTTKRLVVQ